VKLSKFRGKRKKDYGTSSSKKVGLPNKTEPRGGGGQQKTGVPRPPPALTGTKFRLNQEGNPRPDPLEKKDQKKTPGKKGKSLALQKTRVKERGSASA